MKLKNAAIIWGVLTAFFVCGYVFGRCSVSRTVSAPVISEGGVINAEELQADEVTEPEELLFVEPVSDEKSVFPTPTVIDSVSAAEKPVLTAVAPTPNARPIQVGDDTLKFAMATVRDWNLKRVYRKTLFDDPKSGTMQISATVQRNELMRIEYNYTRPTPSEHKRVRPYLRGQIDTRGYYGVSAGVQYKWFGVDAGLIRYGHDKYACAIGMMLIF